MESYEELAARLSPKPPISPAVLQAFRVSKLITESCVGIPQSLIDAQQLKLEQLEALNNN